MQLEGRKKDLSEKSAYARWRIRKSAHLIPVKVRLTSSVRERVHGA